MSLNGADNVGKTTQLHWLCHALPAAENMGKVDRWSARWRALHAGDFTRWWFRDSTTAEHVALVFDSHAARRRASGPLALEDRGWPMLVASCAATAVVKDGLPTRTAVELVEELATGHRVDDRREIHILLRHDGDRSREAELALAREERALSCWYPRYQQALAEILSLQVGAGDYDEIVVRGDRSIPDVQYELRQRLREHGLSPAPPALPH